MSPPYWVFDMSWVEVEQAGMRAVGLATGGRAGGVELIFVTVVRSSGSMTGRGNLWLLARLIVGAWTIWRLVNSSVTSGRV